MGKFLYWSPFSSSELLFVKRSESSLEVATLLLRRSLSNFLVNRLRKVRIIQSGGTLYIENQSHTQTQSPWQYSCRKLNFQLILSTLCRFVLETLVQVRVLNVRSVFLTVVLVVFVVDRNRIPIAENDSTKFSSSFVEMFSFVIIFFLLEVVPYSSLSRIKPAKDGVLALFEERKSFLLLYKWSCILAIVKYRHLKPVLISFCLI